MGAPLGAGTRRNCRVALKRTADFRLRMPRFRKLRRLGIHTAKLMRTGGVAALTYGQGVVGVSPSTLRNQRRMVATATAPVAGGCGQQLDLALVMADGSSRGRADPAFAAHIDPIGQWALAIWEKWLPRESLLKLAAEALDLAIRRQRPWAHCTGPGAAFVLSAARLGWTVHDAFTVTMDDGKPLSFILDPPCVVKRFVADSVRRWRWRSIEEHAPTSHRGASHWFSDMPSCRILKQQRHDLREVKVGP